MFRRVSSGRLSIISIIKLCVNLLRVRYDNFNGIPLSVVYYMLSVVRIAATWYTVCPG